MQAPHWWQTAVFYQIYPRSLADYTGVADEYGTLAEFQKFLDGAHDRGLKITLDWVLIHASHRHPWYQASAAGRATDYADWYIRRPGGERGRRAGAEVGAV